MVSVLPAPAPATTAAGPAVATAPVGDPAALLSNPADAFRLYNLSASQATAAAAGLAGAANAIPPFAALASVLLWPLCGLAAAVLAFRRITP